MRLEIFVVFHFPDYLVLRGNTNIAGWLIYSLNSYKTYLKIKDENSFGELSILFRGFYFGRLNASLEYTRRYF